MRHELPATRPTGHEIQQVRAALGLMRHELAAVLGVHVATLNRWEACGPASPAIEGLPRELLRTLRDRVVRERRTREALATGRYVSQALLRDGLLPAVLELIRFAASRTIRWPALQPEEPAP